MPADFGAGQITDIGQQWQQHNRVSQYNTPEIVGYLGFRAKRCNVPADRNTAGAPILKPAWDKWVELRYQTLHKRELIEFG